MSFFFKVDKEDREGRSQKLSVARHQPNILLVNCLTDLLCHLSGEKASYLVCVRV